MGSGGDIETFIRSSFRSVWSLELLLLLRREPGRGWSQPELVAALRASDLVVSRGIDALLAAGLVLTQANGTSCFHPVSAELERLVDEVATLYARSPDAVRRIITAPAGGGLAAFADAFRLRRD